MRLSYASTILLCASALTFGGAFVAATAQTGDIPKNPVPGDPKSIAAGRKIFQTYCVDCHGSKGKGDGSEGQDMDPHPANFTDNKQEHGTTDADLFVVVRDGTKRGMKSFGKRLSPAQIWDVVNYVETLKAQK